MIGGVRSRGLCHPERDGHVGIATGEYTADGDPIIRTNPWTCWPGINEITLSELEAKCGALYLGYGVIEE